MKMRSLSETINTINKLILFNEGDTSHSDNGWGLLARTEAIFHSLYEKQHELKKSFKVGIKAGRKRLVFPPSWLPAYEQKSTQKVTKSMASQAFDWQSFCLRFPGVLTLADYIHLCKRKGNMLVKSSKIAISKNKPEGNILANG